MLFEIAVVEHPKKDKNGETDELEKLVFGPEWVIAEDEQVAVAEVNDHIVALKAAADEFKKINQKRMEILIRPFA